MGSYHDPDIPMASGSAPFSPNGTPLKDKHENMQILGFESENHTPVVACLNSTRFNSMATINPNGSLNRGVSCTSAVGFQMQATTDLAMTAGPGKRVPPSGKPPTRSPSLKSRSPQRFTSSQRSPVNHEMKKYQNFEQQAMNDKFAQSNNFFSSSHKRNGAHAQLNFASALLANGNGGTMQNAQTVTIGGPSSELDALRLRPENCDGILILAVKDIFTEIEKQIDRKFFIRCSYIEIYMDQVYDLLKPQDQLAETLSINEDASKEFYVKGAMEEIVSSIEEIIMKIRKGESNRHFASTMMNHCSSRSHTIFRLVNSLILAYFDLISLLLVRRKHVGRYVARHQCDH